MIRLRILSLIAALSLASCAKLTAPPSNYTEIEVKNGGSISGTVRYNGTKPPANSIIVTKDQEACGKSHPNLSDPGAGEGIANAIVYLDTITAGKPFADVAVGVCPRRARNGPRNGRGLKPTATLDQIACEFIPHLQIVRTGTKILVSNGDHVTHDFHLLLDGRTVVTNDVQPVGAPPHEITLTQTGLNIATCSIHTWMRGFVMVTSHPYYALTDSNGNYTLANVPPGRYTLKMWRDNWALDQPMNPNGLISGYNWGSDYRNQREVVVEAGKDVGVDFILP